MAVTQDVVVLNDTGASTLSERTRTTGSGTAVRYSIEFRADPILHDFNQERLGQGPAEAIRDVLVKAMKSISADVAPQTALNRANASANFAAGNPSYVARYSGGKMGVKLPGSAKPEGKLFNDSGRFAEGLAPRFNPTDNNFTINVAANRLDPRTFGGGQGAIVAMWNRLCSLAPEFKGGTEILKHPEVREAIATAVAESIVTRTDRAKSTISRARSALFGQVIRDLAKIVSIGA